ncbi:MFS transporter [Azospirillum thermophilum]|uniref:MFS transporter n=1 Tax=Azospirillum thermophilum TaxID=2202148 RepID=A0A2S2CZM3_9PROT|nr:MFS transporter [Azospirillum thermophilum]AWK89964.1 MFS transporter [Azospirillum thermophilum]
MTPGRLALYALPALPLALPTIPVAVLLPAHYADTLGLGLGATAAALGAARLLDVLSDPLVGMLSDRGGRFGRRKPWILAGALIAGIALLNLFSPPAGAGAAHLFGWSLALYLGWTMVQVPYQAWGAELAAGYHERARIAGAREAAGVVGLLLAGGVPALAAFLGWPATAGLAALAWATVALGAPAVAGLLWGVREAAPREAEHAAPELPHSAVWRGLLGNRPFLRLLAAWTVNGLATGVPATLFPFFVGSVLALGETAKGLFLLLYFLSAVAAVPLWLRLARRLEKHRTWCLAMILACAAFLWVPLLGPGDGAAFAVICLVTGAALGADLALPPAMQADVVDYGALKERGRPRAGLYFALWTMATKLALAAAVALALPAVGLFGFDPQADVQLPGALAALAVIYAGLPTVAKVAAVALVWGHPLTRRRHAAIRRRLDKHRSPEPP